MIIKQESICELCSPRLWTADAPRREPRSKRVTVD
jgi:hypothetical protein